MDPSYEELVKQLQETERLRAEAERLRAEAERLRAEAEQNAIAEKQRADKQAQQVVELQEQRRPTTLIEYFQLCHDHLSTKFRVQTDRRFTTQGIWTDPAGKYCPRRLAQWDGFLDEQRAALGKVIAFFPETLQLLESRDFVQGIGSRLAAGSPIGSERDLERFHHTAVELPVQCIIDQFTHSQQHADAIPPLLGVGDGIFFENHMNILNSDTTPSTSAAPSTPPPPPHVPPTNKISIRPDQICVYRSLNGDRTLAYVLEYKAPHKLTAQHVREGIEDLDVVRDVVNCVEIPNNDDDRFRYFARRLSAAAATQTYHYMLQAGLEMGLVATGEVMIFLKIDWADPSTLYYHVAEPTHECQAQPTELIPYCTAVSQLLAFTVMALLGPGSQGQDARDRAISGASTWNEDWDEILARMGNTPAARTPPSSGRCWEPRIYVGYDRSPIPFRHPRRKKSPQADEPPPSLGRGQGPPPPDDEDAGPNPDSHPLLLPAKEGRRGSVALRSHPELQRRRHGYTLAAKGTTSSSVRFIEHEARIYEQLQPIQGLFVPVSLGTIDLREVGRRYFYAADVHIIYFLLLSWAGRDLREAREQPSSVGIRRNVIRSLQSLHALGVAHGDVRRENLVWSHRPSDPVMVIDFERSVLTKASCQLGLLGGSEDGEELPPECLSEDDKLFEQDLQKATYIWV
ncbi:hypothetical protein QC762_0050250 [Podospora pseudocomata]|uniref:Protein kinase domain-containing protein n=1 Tax=Podospora pseudocomata TaxID=2093779 RepID=A0ABR0GI91_9PEZI|nr:hypothetical protein QC762_0050250 [Podospora pseudocomata]